MPAGATIQLPTPAHTASFGEELGKTARPGDIITLAGDLGAGKTTLTQAIGRGLLVPSGCYITSPTFSLIHEYPGRIPLYHIDLYRLSGEDDIEPLGLEEYLYGDGLCVIEWPERLGRFFPEACLRINLRILAAFSREAFLQASGLGWKERLAQLIKQVDNN